MLNLRIATLILALAAAPLLAQHHDNATEKKASDEVTFSTKVKISGKVLEAGKYRIACDRKELSFTRISSGEKFAIPCQGKDMGKKAETTELSTTLDKDGARVATGLLLRGSNIDHTL